MRIKIALLSDSAFPQPFSLLTSFTDHTLLGCVSRFPVSGEHSGRNQMGLLRGLASPGRACSVLYPRTPRASQIGTVRRRQQGVHSGPEFRTVDCAPRRGGRGRGWTPVVRGLMLGFPGRRFAAVQFKVRHWRPADGAQQSRQGSCFFFFFLATPGFKILLESSRLIVLAFPQITCCTVSVGCTLLFIGTSTGALLVLPIKFHQVPVRACCTSTRHPSKLTNL